MGDIAAVLPENAALATRVAYALPDPGIPVGGTKGASVHVSAICRAMARMGVEVTLYAARVAGALSGPGAERVTVKELSFGKVPSGPAGEEARIAGAPVFYERLAEALQERPAEVVIERLSLFAGSGAEVAEGAGAGRILEVNAPVAAERARHFGLTRAEEAAAAERSAVAGARVVAVSAPLARWALSQGAASAVAIPNGADVELLDPARWQDHAAALREVLGLGNRVVVGFVGSLKPWHGVEVLLEAMERVDASLVVVGDGPMRESLEAMAARSGVAATFVGAVSSAEIPSYLAAMDIAVAPYSPSDSFYFSPLKVVEAMAAARPVVASGFAPVAEALGGTGMLVRPGDADELGAAIATLAADPELRIRLGDSARSRAVRHFDWEKVAAKVLAEAPPGRAALPFAGREARAI